MFGTARQGGSVRALLVDAVAKINTVNNLLKSRDLTGPNAAPLIAAFRESIPKYLDQAEADLRLALELERQVIGIFESAEKQVDAQLKAKL